jgi:hypothetical protein
MRSLPAMLRKALAHGWNRNRRDEKAETGAPEDEDAVEEDHAATSLRRHEGITECLAGSDRNSSRRAISVSVGACPEIRL